jgi:hypothetical protein
MRLGSELSPATQAECKARFIHRFTGENRPAWANKPMDDGTPYPLQFKDDADWLAHTLFCVNKDGTLNGPARYCESSPTWPEGKPARPVKWIAETGKR